MVLIKLRLKYRVRRSFSSGKYQSRTGNSHGPTPKGRRFPAGFKRFVQHPVVGW